MATSTHRIELSNDAYTNVSNGNINCSIGIGQYQSVRLVIGGSEPPVNTPDYIPITGPTSADDREYAFACITGLEAEDDVWLKADGDVTVVHVIRGPAVFAI